MPLIVIAASLPLAAQQTGTRDNGAGLWGSSANGLGDPAPAFVNTTQPVFAPVSRVFWDLSEQRTGRVNVLSIRLEAETDPGAPVAVELALPDGVRFAEGSAAKQTVADWTRGTVIANAVQDYSRFRKKSEKRLSATLSWRVEADAPLDAMAAATLSGAAAASIAASRSQHACMCGVPDETEIEYSASGCSALIVLKWLRSCRRMPR